MSETKKKRVTKAYVKKRACPKCGPGTSLAEHKNRLSCGKCHYTESKK